MPYRLSEPAENDIRRIYVEGALRFGAGQADAYFDRLMDTFELIEANPLIARERTEIAPSIRVHPVGTHVIVYEIIDAEVRILRIRHSREDWRSAPAG